MSYRLEVTVPGLPKINTAATRRNRFVQSREAKTWKAIVVTLAGPRRPEKPLSRARLFVTRFSASQADRCNMAQAAKALVDGLVAARVLLDDSPTVLLEERYEWERAERGCGNTVLVVEEA